MPDIIIIGNGITGGTLACALARQGLDVSIIDKEDTSQPIPSDGRSFALSSSSKDLFSNLGIWQNLEEITPILNIHTSDGVLPRWVEFDGKDVGGKPLGYVVDSALLKSKIKEKVNSFKNITLHTPATVLHLKRTSSHVLIETSQGATLKSPLCVASDGRFSKIREWAEIPLKEWSYNQTAIVCNMAHSLPHHNQAFEHFLPSGPLAFVPRPGNHSGLVWSLETEKAKTILSLSPEDFAAEVQAHFGSALGYLTLSSERRSYPLSVCLPKRLTDTRLALLGDAAHVIHPVAGQGLNVGLRDVASLSHVINQAFGLGLDHGSPSILADYQKRRRADILSMTFLTDGIVRVFSTQNRPMARVRSLGFGLVKNCSFLKNLMIRHAMGNHHN